MQVIDQDRSERGPQRRQEGNRLLHCCCICGKVAVWDSNWCMYGSEKDLDDGIAVAKFCSKRCKIAAGPNGRNVLPEMKRTAKSAEWRAPEIVYREATAREKYRAALDRQKPR
jgi:hypothetical protein